MDRLPKNAWIPATTALVAVAVAICAGPVRAAVAPRLLCIVRLGEVPGLAPEDLGPALRLEQRKRGESWESVEVVDPADCPVRTDVVLALGPPGIAEVRASRSPSPPPGPQAGMRMNLSGVDPLDRPAEVARIVASGLVAPAAPTDLVEAEVARLSHLAGAPALAASGPAGYVRLGGLWTWVSGPDVHAAGADFEAGASLFDERLEVGLRVGWEPPRSATTPAGSRRAQAVPVVAAVRGGLRLGRVRLLAGLAGGIEWRRMELEPATRFGRLSQDSLAGLLEGSIEGVVAAWGPLRIAVAGVFRGYFGGPTLAWNGRTAWEAPAWSAGLALRLGALIPAGPRKPAPAEAR